MIKIQKKCTYSSTNQQEQHKKLANFTLFYIGLLFHCDMSSDGGSLAGNKKKKPLSFCY